MVNMKKWAVPALMAFSGTTFALEPVNPEKALVQGNTAFALDLYAKLRETEKGNLFFSPYSLSTALGMTYAGARGETAAEMAKVLHFDLAPDSLHPAFAGLRKRLTAGKGCDLAIANRLWGQKGYVFLEPFLTIAEEQYGSPLAQLDFKKETEAARQEINRWVDEETKNRIWELIPSGVLKHDTRLVLTNAIYFKGDWASEFDKRATRTEPFFVTSDHSVQVPLMRQKGVFRFMRRGNVAALELPYKGKGLSMVLFLPDAKDGLAAFEETVSARQLEAWTGESGAWEKEEMEIFLPRFEMSHSCEALSGILEKGMPLAFDEKLADFTGMTGRDLLCIDTVIHKAFLKVDEKGSEAAAATAVVMKEKCVSSRPPAPRVFRADHPFFILIRDDRTGSILFMGRVVDPS